MYTTEAVLEFIEDKILRMKSGNIKVLRDDIDITAEKIAECESVALSIQQSANFLAQDLIKYFDNIPVYDVKGIKKCAT